jgi:hypothetical protein
LAVANSQDGPEKNGIGRIPVLALPQVGGGGRVKRVEPNRVGDGLVLILGPPLAEPEPVSASRTAGGATRMHLAGTP